MFSHQWSAKFGKRQVDFIRASLMHYTTVLDCRLDFAFTPVGDHSTLSHLRCQIRFRHGQDSAALLYGSNHSPGGHRADVNRSAVRDRNDELVPPGKAAAALYDARIGERYSVDSWQGDLNLELITSRTLPPAFLNDERASVSNLHPRIIQTAFHQSYPLRWPMTKHHMRTVTYLD